MKRIYVFILKIFQKYRLRHNELSRTSVINPKAKLANVRARDYTRFAEYSDVRDSDINSYSTIGRFTKIVNAKVGKFCAISWDCTINAVTHPYDHLSIHAFPYVPHAGEFVKERTRTISEVEIGNDVWVGANSVIMPGVTIGDGAIVGASAVVTKDVPPYAIVIGVPAKVIKYRFSDEIIDKLMHIRWWDFDREVLIKNIDLFKRPLSIEIVSELESCQ